MIDLLNEYAFVRKHTEDICAPLETEDYVPQPVEHVSPPKWHLGHTTWFFETFVLMKYCEDYRPFDTDYQFLFNSYYESAGERVPRHKRGDLSRPTVRKVYEYRRYVDSQMRKFLQYNNLSKEITDLVVLGINHEQQHQELLYTDIKFIFCRNPLNPVYSKERVFDEKELEPGEFVHMDSGVREIGYRGDGFCFDNELQPHEELIQPFEIRKHLVTNGEYIQFIESGGYEDFSFWHSEGWSWVRDNGIFMPKYWQKIDDKWFRFTLNGLKEVNLKEAMCHINYYEASAFAEWKGMRLPTESEWEAASGRINWGSRWEWTGSAYLPYPGFCKVPGAVGEYNGKFMVNQMVLRGASVATPKNHSHHTYRNFFHPHYRWQFSGIRLVRK